MNNNIFNEKDVDITEKIFVRKQTEAERLQDKIAELAGNRVPEEERVYAIWFGKLCNDAGSTLGEDRQFLVFENVPEYTKDGELVDAHTEIVTEPGYLPTIGGQVFSIKAAVKLGKYIAEKLGKTIADIEKELKNS